MCSYIHASIHLWAACIHATMPGMNETNSTGVNKNPGSYVSYVYSCTKSKKYVGKFQYTRRQLHYYSVSEPKKKYMQHKMDKFILCMC
jgi:hypothetical protein